MAESLLRRLSGKTLAWIGKCLMSLGGMMLALPAYMALSPPMSDGSRQTLPFPALVLLLVIGVTLGVVGESVRRLGRRLAALTAEELLVKDRRPPILLLRTFDDDRVRAVGSRTRREDESLPAFAQQVRETVKFEEMLIEVLQARGPVIAIGRPGERLPPAGAARLYVGDGDWQTKVCDLLRKCQRAVLLMGRIAEHEGLAWELQQLVALGQPGKMLFLMPPVTEEEAKARWEMFRKGGSCSLPPYQGGELAVEFSLWSMPVVHRSASGRRDLEAYEAVLRPKPLAISGGKTRTCPHCSRALPADFSFCRDCGTWLK